LSVVAAVVVLVTMSAGAVGAGGGGSDGNAATGVVLSVDGAFDGFTLIAPSESKTTYLVDLDGEVAHGRGYVLDESGVYEAEVARVVWPHGPDPDFFAHHTSGAQRLPNGNTLIADGPNGVIFEVTPSREKVWEYVNPYFDRSAETVELNDQEVFKRRLLFRAERHAPNYPGVAALTR
jgi:hypothetical protein